MSRVRLDRDDTNMQMVYQIGRTIPEGGQGTFYVYRSRTDVTSSWEPQSLVDQFPKPIRRVTDTQSRSKFKLVIRVLATSEGDLDV